MVQEPHGSNRASKGIALFVSFFAAAAVFVGIGFLPAGMLRNILMPIAALVVIALFFWVLASRLVRLFAGHGSYPLEAGLALLNVAVVISTFAAAYAQNGIADTTRSSEPVMTYRFTDALYFSCVTFTTLGYGDMQPRGVNRVLACLEVFMGYVVLGLIASTATNFVQAAAKSKQEDKPDDVAPANA